MNSPKVVIEIEGGVATVTQKPKGVEVEIRDFDTDNGKVASDSFSMDFEIKPPKEALL